MPQVVLIAHNLRSCHNVGSLLRTAEGLGVQKIFLTGYTPYPAGQQDKRLPHLALAIHRRIQKTALGAEESAAWEQCDFVENAVAELRTQGFTIAGLEQAADSVSLPSFAVPDKIAVIVGREVEGIEPEILGLCDVILEIPMFGQKESFNVVQAAAMVLYHCAFNNQDEKVYFKRERRLY